MTFTVRDLMLDVFPASDANAEQLQLCELATQGPPKPNPKPKPKPGPGPKPGPKPGCAIQTAPNGPSQIAANVELASLTVLRQQLQQALHP
jgi:hypothetical protein